MDIFRLRIDGKMIISDRVPKGQKKYLLKEKYGLDTQSTLMKKE